MASPATVIVRKDSRIDASLLRVMALELSAVAERGAKLAVTVTGYLPRIGHWIYTDQPEPVAVLQDRDGLHALLVPLTAGAATALVAGDHRLTLTLARTRFVTTSPPDDDVSRYTATASVTVRDLMSNALRLWVSRARLRRATGTRHRESLMDLWLREATIDRLCWARSCSLRWTATSLLASGRHLVALRAIVATDADKLQRRLTGYGKHSIIAYAVERQRSTSSRGVAGVLGDCRCSA